VTDRLYYTDPYVTAFDAQVMSIEPHDGRPAAILDRTAFYPTSGGQPFDTGRLGDAAVIDVVDRDDGTILHVLDRDISPGAVRGAIDWARRFEHMQQHTGQHLLSAAFDRLFRVRTESFHLGAQSSTIDLARTVSAQEIDAAEDEANRIVWEDRPITIRFADAAEAAALPLRKESTRGGRLRLVEVTDFDISACGGTHVARTGGVGVIAVSSSERFRGGSRLEFVCGVRTLRAFRLLRDSIAASVRLVSALPGELPAGIERLQADARDTRRQLKEAQARLAGFEAAALASRAAVHRDARVVVEALEGWDQGGLKTIASMIAARPGHIAVLFSTPPPSAVVIARADGSLFDSAAAMRRLIEAFGGKGGGRPDLAQGGGLQATPETLVAFARSFF
jgi:alanyl-tRNA synthetase